MPLVKVNIEKGKSKKFLAELLHCIMDCVQQSLKLPPDDRNIRLCEFEKDMFFMKQPYSIIIEISLFAGRTIDTKRKLYQSLVSVLSEQLKLKKEEIFILLNEQPKENWGIRGGIAASDIDLGFKVEV